MLRLLKISILTVLVSFYLFPITFTFLPHGLNSKMILAGIGIAAFAFDCIRNGAINLSGYTVMSATLAILFSVWCLFSVTLSNTYDYTYATYIVSFLTWMTGAYGAYFFLRIGYGEVDLEILTRYLALVGVFQCVTAVLIDNVQAFSNFVDMFMYQEDNYYKVHHRMYGIGAALDPAGVRFSTILVLIAHQFSTNPNVRKHDLYQVTDMVAFAVITIIGCVISRTTMLGVFMGLGYMVLSMLKMRQGGFITTRMVKIFFITVLVIGGMLGLGIYLFRHSPEFEGYLRFGFEAFFNWAETGELRTSSTDTLNEMWVWPEDARTWAIGRGTFGVFDNDSDIGYCNFCFYCGIVGLVIFSIFFIYNHFSHSFKFRHFWITSILFTALTFIVWLKVTTDIFFINALLFCISADVPEEEFEEPDLDPDSIY